MSLSCFRENKMASKELLEEINKRACDYIAPDAETTITEKLLFGNAIQRAGTV